MNRQSPKSRNDYPHQLLIPTRWADNDVYGHLNNSVYYFYFDTVVNRFLIDTGLLEIGKSEIIGLVVGTSCDFFAPAAFPDAITAGLRVARLGNSSVTYEIGLFKNENPTAIAQGSFTHVYVNEATRRPTPLSDIMREKLEEITP